MATSHRSLIAPMRTCTLISRCRSGPFSIPLRSSTGSSQQHYLLSPSFTSIRHATHQAQGRANGPKNGPGKRLGAKKTGEQAVVPGNIIFRQRGTKWFPGDNVGMGRDHTLFAREAGFVKYYRDPRRHPTRRYVGVVFERHHVLPAAPHAATRRRLNMVPVPRRDLAAELEERRRADEEARGRGGAVVAAGRRMRPDYSFREGNWEIGRAAERAGVRIREFRKGDRWLAWRKASARKKRNLDAKSLTGASKKAKKPKKAARKAVV